MFSPEVPVVFAREGVELKGSTAGLQLFDKLLVCCKIASLTLPCIEVDRRQLSLELRKVELGTVRFRKVLVSAKDPRQVVLVDREVPRKTADYPKLRWVL